MSASASAPFRLVSWNVEWFDRLFGDDRLDLSEAWSARYEVTRRQQAEAIAHVLRRLDADAVLVVEAPDDGPRRSTVKALEGFAAWAGLRASRTALGFPNHTRQEIALMHDPARVAARHAPGDHPGAPRFDGIHEESAWSKPPLELDLVTPLGDLRLIGVHAKSKSTNGAAPGETTQVAIANRRKQLAQCAWLAGRARARIVEGVPLIVAGDFNDGPGLDAFEALFGRSGVEIVLAAGLHDPHAVPPRLGGAAPTTARFWDNRNERWLNALLDFAMVSAPLAKRASWRILHPFDDPEAAADPALRQALLDASDHFPVVLDLAPAP